MATLPSPADPHWLIKTVTSRWPRTAPAAVLMSAAFIANGLTPVLVGRAIDDAIATGNPRRLALWVGALLATF